MIRTLPGSFRTFSNNNIIPDINVWNLVDFGGITPPGSRRSLGSTTINVLPLTPTQSQKWTIQSVSFVSELAFCAGDTTFGKFGKVLVGLMPEGVDSGTQFFGTNPPFIPLPPDASLLSTIWDPATDPMPPVGVFGVPPATLPATAQVTPATPRALDAGQNMGVGIWMLPSLTGIYSASAGQGGILVLRTKFIVTYNDGE